MKKLLFLPVFLLMATMGSAQFIHSTGIKGGVSISNQNWEYGNSMERNTDYRVGYYAGISAEMLRSKFFSLTADIGYIQKGMQEEWMITNENNPEGTGETRTMDSRFDYLSFSPAAKFFYPFGDFAPYLVAGPRMDYYLGDKSDLGSPSTADEFNNLTLGLSYGIGAEYQLNNIILLLEVQHQPDFTRFIDIDPSATNVGVSASNTALVVNLGIKYSLE